MVKKIPHFIAGKQVIGEAAPTHWVYDPAFGEIQAEVSVANISEINRTVAEAKKAFSTWRDVAPLKRARVLFEFKQILEQRQQILAECITHQHGKTVSDALGECLRGLEVVEFACGIPHLLKGSYSNNVGGHVDCYTLQQPLGVCVGATPFNFPVMIPLWMFPIAIACGNSFILKPSEKTPEPSLLLAEWLQEAGLPPGVLNVLQGDAAVVSALIEHPDVQAVSFVGSTPVARSIYRQAAEQGKRVQSLGGAKNHCVVLSDASIPQAVEGILGAAFGSAGERCMAISVVVLVGDHIAEPFLNKLMQKMKALRVGPGMDPQSEMGPLITQQHLEYVEQCIAEGQKEGAKLCVDGRGLHIANHETGFFIGPTLFDEVTPHMSIYQKEIFGPVLSVVRVSTLKEAVELINDHPFGNGTAIYTQSGLAAREFSNQVQCGMVGVNVPIPVPMAFYSFGGCKQSLFGSHKMHGVEGVQFYTQRKTVTARWQGPIDAQYSMPVL